VKPLHDIAKLTMRSAGPECQSRSRRVRKRLQWGKSDHSSSQSSSRSSSSEGESLEATPTRKKKSVKCLSDSEISSPEKQSAMKLSYLQRQYLKPPNLGGSTSFESFIVQFQCGIISSPMPAKLSTRMN